MKHCAYFTGYFIYSGYFHLSKAYHYLQATIIYDPISGFSPLINGVTQQLHRWVKVAWEHPGYKQPPNKLSKWGSFWFPCKASVHKCIQLVLPSHLASERAKMKGQISMDFVRGKKNLSSMDSHCYKYEGIKKKNNPVKTLPISKLLLQNHFRHFCSK